MLFDRLRREIKKTKASDFLSVMLREDKSNIQKFLIGDKEYGPEELSTIGVLLGLTTMGNDVFVLRDGWECRYKELRSGKRMDVVMD